MGYSRPNNLLRTVLAPLFVLSVGLHALLLIVPLPSRPEPPETPEENIPSDEADGVVDLLSISSLAAPEPDLMTEPPPAVEAPPPAATPPPPAQPVVPETYPEAPPAQEPPPPEEPAGEELAPEQYAELEPEPPPLGFDPNRQAQLVGGVAGSLGRDPGQSNFDLTEQFPGDIWDLYVSQWDPGQHQCFFGTIDRSSYTLPPGAGDLRYLSRNIREIERTDIPRTFPDQTINALGMAYCNQPFFEVLDGGTPILWLSLVPVSPGGSTALVIIWQQDPRAG
jgi:hypothetical protein